MNTAILEAQRQMEAADKALYSDAVKLRNLVVAKGTRCSVKQAYEFTIATETNLKARVDHARKMIDAIGGTDTIVRTILGTGQFILTVAETELDRRAALAAAAE